jgi:two-component system, cell cycle sensor histidine kinase and response regulator CckA
MAKAHSTDVHGLDGEAYPLLFESVDNMVCTLDLEGRITTVNHAGERLTGYARDQLVGRSALDLIAPDARERATQQFRARVANNGDRTADESVLVARDGRRIPIEVTSALVLRHGRPESVLGIVRDLTERRRAEEALRQSEQRFHDAFESAAIGMALVAPDGRFLEVNASLCQIVGYSADELVACTFQDITHPDDLDTDLGYVRQMLSGEISSYQMEKRYFHRDGEIVWVLLSVSLVKDGGGRPLYFVSQIQDISERKRAQQALEQSRAQLAEAQRTAQIGSWQKLESGAYGWSDELSRILGIDRDDGPHSQDRLLELVHPDDRERLLAALERVDASANEELSIELRIVRPDGAVRWVHSRGRGGEGGAVRVGTVQDITERKEAELQYRTLVEHLPLTMFNRPLQLHATNLFISPQVEEMLGYPAEQWLNDPDLTRKAIHPDDRERVLEAAARLREHGEPMDLEYRYVAPDGRIVWVLDRSYLIYDDTGAPLYVQGFLADITARKQVEADRDRLGDELHRAQKLEALGRLAGGVAHDFNNMLTAIRGYSELLLDRLEPGSPAYDEAAEIRRAAEQATGLPQQLLAFGRRQSLEPKLVDLNEVVSTARGLLRHLLTETIELVAIPEAAAATTLVDPGQIEHALVNLALNARDAMPDGGRLTIATRDAEVDAALAAEHDAAPGKYVVVAVTDTGTGMDDEMQARAFEPFFTTKAQGEGTGLGLASVYGTVTQSDGFVRLESAPGAGTTVELYFRHAAVPAAAPRNAQPARRRLPTVLVAEDEDIVRRLAADVLSRSGFRVLTAADGAEALRLHEHLDGPLDALVTDVVMPGVGGRELAERIREIDPRLPIVFMSGYAGQAGSADLGSLERAGHLQKPFSPRTLVDAVRHAVGDVDLGTERAADAPTTCLVADDHPTVLDSVARFLESRQFEVVRARNGTEALEKIASLKPALALLDAAMKPLGGIEVARRGLDASAGTRIVVYTGHNDQALLDEALAAGARGFVLKEGSLPELERALRVVAGGGTYVDARVAAANGPSIHLTPREHEVLTLVADGMTNDRVAARLSISPETVQSHIRKAMDKLDADTRTEAVANALRRSLIA